MIKGSQFRLAKSMPVMVEGPFGVIVTFQAAGIDAATAARSMSGESK
jgi:hypothetical protein